MSPILQAAERQDLTGSMGGGLFHRMSPYKATRTHLCTTDGFRRANISCLDGRRSQPFDPSRLAAVRYVTRLEGQTPTPCRWPATLAQQKAAVVDRGWPPCSQPAFLALLRAISRPARTEVNELQSTPRLRTPLLQRPSRTAANRPACFTSESIMATPI